MEPWPTRREVAELARRIDRIGRRMDAHEREHTRADQAREAGARERERQRRTTRRYWATTIITVAVSNVGTWITLAVTHHG